MSKFAEEYPFEHDLINGGVEIQSIIEGPLASWAEQEERYGATIRLKHLYELNLGVLQGETKLHYMGWFSREGINPDTGEIYSYHMAACECYPTAENNDNLRIMLSCPGFLAGMAGRLSLVKEDPTLWTILNDSPDNGLAERYEIADVGEADPRVVEAIMYLLMVDREHPEAWIGNIRSGSHQIGLLSQVLDQDPEITKKYAMLMSARGIVDCPHGTDIQLAA